MSKIEWTEKTWNPIVGCSIVSPGCTNCYAMRMAARIEKIALSSHYDGLTQPSKAGPVWTGKLARANDHIFTEPLRRRKPTIWFVNSMGDLFHESIPDPWIDDVFRTISKAQHHTYQILTKRADRMRGYMQLANWRNLGFAAWPPRCVWLGVSAERQEEADERIPHLLNTPAAVRFVSCEPLLGSIDLVTGGEVTEVGYINWLRGFDGSDPVIPGLDWIIVGGESGPGARPMHPQWARDIRDQCKAAGVPFFFKQFGAWLPIIDRDHDDPDWRADWGLKERQPETYRICNLAGGMGFHGERVHLMKRVGKARAGRTLDGVIHHAMPEVRA